MADLRGPDERRNGEDQHAHARGHHRGESSIVTEERAGNQHHAFGD